MQYQRKEPGQKDRSFSYTNLLEISLEYYSSPTPPRMSQFPWSEQFGNRGYKLISQISCVAGTYRFKKPGQEFSTTKTKKLWPSMNSGWWIGILISYHAKFKAFGRWKSPPPQPRKHALTAHPKILGVCKVNCYGSDTTKFTLAHPGAFGADVLVAVFFGEITPEKVGIVYVHSTFVEQNIDTNRYHHIEYIYRYKCTSIYEWVICEILNPAL